MNNPGSQSNKNPFEYKTFKPVLKVIGLGGGGSNAVNRMIELGLPGVEFIAANTDSQALKSSLAEKKVQIGPLITRGLGAGGNPQVGYDAARESVQNLADALEGADMVFLTAGMGGGTGTGAISIAAQVAKHMGAVTVAIVTTPFGFEMGRRKANAQEGLARLRQQVDTLITIPNDRLLNIAPRDLPLDMAFRLADDVLRQGIQGISELINQTGYINVDFSHIRNVMKNGGGSLLSIGIGRGKDKAQQAIYNALHHPLLESVNIENASAIIANITAGTDLPFIEVTEALNNLHEQTGRNADIIPGVIVDPKLEDRCQVILIITGLGATPIESTPVTTSHDVPLKQFNFATAVSQRQVQESVNASVEVTVDSTNLDLPAFLRRRNNR
ncbi:MAG: cell division protein FtsZ [Chloroflexi bacterium 44-23]|nr:MAG: cell division protein FtsZ [Chloroflexi bacterium 44-23]